MVQNLAELEKGNLNPFTARGVGGEVGGTLRQWGLLVSAESSVWELQELSPGRASVSMSVKWDGTNSCPALPRLLWGLSRGNMNEPAHGVGQQCPGHPFVPGPPVLTKEERLIISALMAASRWPGAAAGFLKVPTILSGC